MTYTWKEQGITINSNYPKDYPIPSGSNYTVDIHFKLPIYVIAIMTGIISIGTIEIMVQQPAFEQVLKKVGYNGKITNYKYNIDWWGNDIKITFTSESIPAGLLGYALILLLIGLIAWMVDIGLSIVLGPPVGGSGGGAGGGGGGTLSQVNRTILLLGILTGGGIILYYLYKKKRGAKK
ncbi:MAG: hypothetical protein QXF15_03605 [Candidatus Aenigmatarchaeota archaeon]